MSPLEALMQTRDNLQGQRGEVRPGTLGEKVNALAALMGQTWPAQLAKSAYGAVTLPGDVYAGRVDPVSDEGIGRSADLAGLIMGGTFGGAPRGALGSGPVRRPINETANDVADRLKAEGLRVNTVNWGTNVGNSSYITPQYVDSFGSLHTFPQVRVSDHSVGPRRYGDHYHIDEMGSGVDETISSIKEKVAVLEQTAARRKSIFDAVYANPQLTEEIAKLPKDTGRALKMMRAAGIDTNIDDVAVVLRKMRGDLK